MAYDEFLAERIREYFQNQKANFYEKKMFGGLCFMVNDKMCCGIHFDKKKNCDFLMARIGEEAYEDAIQQDGCFPMDFTGRPMKGYVFVVDEFLDHHKDLHFWLDLCLQFNPQAKSSKRRHR